MQMYNSLEIMTYLRWYYYVHMGDSILCNYHIYLPSP